MNVVANVGSLGLVGKGPLDPLGSQAAAKAGADAKKQAGIAEANAQAERAAQAQRDQMLSSMNMNFAADLKGENLSNVIAGGSAEASGLGPEKIKRKKASGLSSTLGMV